MESAFRSLSSSAKSPSLMSRKAYYGTKTHPFPQPPAPPQQPPLLPLPAVQLQASQQHTYWPASRPVVPDGAKIPRHAAPSPKKPAPAQGASAPIPVAAAPAKRRAVASEREVEWMTEYSVSPPPSSVPMPTSLLVTAAGRRKVQSVCAVEVAGGGCVDVGATDELRRLLRL